MAKQGGGNGFKIPLVLLVLVGLLRFGGKLYRMSNQNSSRESGYPKYEYPNVDYPKAEDQSESLEKARRIMEETQGVINPTNAQTESGKSISQFNGAADYSVGHYPYTSIKQKGDTTFIMFDVEIMPTCLKCLEEYVPALLLKPGWKTERKLVLVFRKPGYPEVMFSHTVVISPESGIRVWATTTTTGTFQRVWIKPIAIQKFRYKGFATLMDVQGKIIKRDTIEMWKKGLHQTEIRYNGERVDAVDGTTETDKTRGVRLRCVLNNLERLNQKTLFPNYENTLKELWIYNFDVVQTVHSGVRDSILLTGWNTVKDAKLNWLFNSSADDMSYFTYSEETVDIKYFIEIETGSVEGMQMAKFSKDKKVVERVELFKVQ